MFLLHLDTFALTNNNTSTEAMQLPHLVHHSINLPSQIVCGAKNNAAHTILWTPSLSIQLLYNLQKE